MVWTTSKRSRLDSVSEYINLCPHEREQRARLDRVLFGGFLRLVPLRRHSRETKPTRRREMLLPPDPNSINYSDKQIIKFV